MDPEATILMALQSFMEMAVILSSVLERGARLEPEKQRAKYHKLHKAISLARGVVLEAQFSPKPKRRSSTRRPKKH